MKKNATNFWYGKTECILCQGFVQTYYLNKSRMPLCGKCYLAKKQKDRERRGLK
jgi:hypothetical protein